MPALHSYRSRQEFYQTLAGWSESYPVCATFGRDAKSGWSFYLTTGEVSVWEMVNLFVARDAFVGGVDPQSYALTWNVRSGLMYDDAQWQDYQRRHFGLSKSLVETLNLDWSPYIVRARGQSAATDPIRH